MKNLITLIIVILTAGCQQQEQPRQYTEVVSEPVAQPVAQVQEQPASTDNPHAGVDMAKLTPEAKAALQKMLAQGQDPHAGLDMSSFGAKDPHAGLDMSGMMAAGTSTTSPYAWDIPKGFKQGANKGMRLASFYVDGAPDAIDCSIVSLAGMAGGLEANLKRWMGQIGLQVSDADFTQFTNAAQTIKTAGGFEAKLYDFTSLQKTPADKSMIAAIITTNGSTIFVKMTGSSDNLKKYENSFLELLKSLRGKDNA